MRDIAPPSTAVVVAIDGSRRAINVALWAVDEALVRDLPLRLLYAIEPHETVRLDSLCTAHDFAVAESAVRHAAMAIESTSRPVKIEVEIVYERLLTALAKASQSAAMVCVHSGCVGETPDMHRGAVLAQLLDESHCLVAVINGEQTGQRDSSVVTGFTDSPECPTVLGHAVDEARLRHAALRVATGWRPGFTDIHDSHAKLNLERALARYRRLYPEVDIEAVAVAGNPINYLADNVDTVGLIVLGHDTTHQLIEVGDPGLYAALTDLHCSVLIAPRYGPW
ncbi:universal stress protein [Mycolicibacterium sp. 120266]|uniref:universal stress protein n=1 Tax=Mycolicibacterium sp. 120266 TaxID=3090601 RepID=UPI00299E6A50|nr:universal stress protein [Mycolicibacterium sp. 120266]MDX1875122.1 universal stress protein [Mycolicibacterium sp. 120266]